jgi:sarcosine oxidase
MALDFKYIVVGRGMMGAAAARHLATAAEGVAVIGPDEPKDLRAHTGVFASHYDEARIIRTFDDNRLWSTLASRSLARFGEMEAQSGIVFSRSVGCLFAGPAPKDETVYLGRAFRVRDQLGLDVETIAPEALGGRFPEFSLDRRLTGYFERERAGYLNPRALVRAETVLAKAAGAVVIDDTVVAVRDNGGAAEVVTASGDRYTAERVLVAAGGFSNFHSLLPRPVDMRVTARTVVFFELGDRERAIFANMPSAVVFAERDEDLVYILPPVVYPDGKTYLKIGGDSEGRVFSSLGDIGDWFRSEGDPAERDHLVGIARKIMPGLEGCPISSAACVASFTRTSYPYVGFTDAPRIAVLTGGNFVAAKCSDELGRLGALLVREGGLGTEDFGAELTPIFV